MRKLTWALLLSLIWITTALAAKVVMVEKRQAVGVGYPLESSRRMELPDGQVVQLVTCCGLNQDDSALYTVRDRDGYTLVDRKFTSGRYFLGPKGRVIAVQKTGPSFTVTFSDHLLHVIKEIKLVDVQNLTVGDRGSVAVLARTSEGSVLRVYDAAGERRWQAQDAPEGSLYFLPQEKLLIVTAGDTLYLHAPDGENVKTFKTGGPVRYIGADRGAGLMFLLVNRKEGAQVQAIDLKSYEERWAHHVADQPAGHCGEMEVELSRYVQGAGVVGLLLRCPGDRVHFYVARFLDKDGKMVGQQKLGRRIDASFFEIGTTFAIVSDGFVYTFARSE
ncbi:MAG: hypothetical protein P9L99_13775 [Candidatus Lernaella stagnicola]|nr:hypothetical protein [Candidatus Lernaella stagnicola]